MVIADGGPLKAPMENTQTLRGYESMRCVSRILGLSHSGVFYPYQPIAYVILESEQDRTRLTRDIDGSLITHWLDNQIRHNGD